MDFEKLSKIDVTSHIEKKGKFAYLSWCFAVREFRIACPDGTWEIRHFDDKPYCKDAAGGFVEVTVIPDATTDTIIGYTQVHPILDHRNKSIPAEDISAFDVNTSIMRCLVKAIALATGIGLHIYAGEDLPPGDIKDSKIDEINKEDDMETIMHQIKEAKDTDTLTALYNKNKKYINSLMDDDKDGILGQFKNKKESLNG